MKQAWMIGLGIVVMLTGCASHPQRGPYGYGAGYDFPPPVSEPIHGHLGHIVGVDFSQGQQILRIQLYGGGIFSYTTSEEKCFVIGQAVRLDGKDGQRTLVILPN